MVKVMESENNCWCSMTFRIKSSFLDEAGWVTGSRAYRLVTGKRGSLSESEGSSLNRAVMAEAPRGCARTHSAIVDWLLVEVETLHHDTQKGASFSVKSTTRR